MIHLLCALASGYTLLLTGFQQQLPPCSQLMKIQPVMRGIQRRTEDYEEMHREIKHL